MDVLKLDCTCFDWLVQASLIRCSLFYYIKRTQTLITPRRLPYCILLLCRREGNSDCGLSFLQDSTAVGDVLMHIPPEIFEGR
jgi:hypothetical protein